jgi:DNA-binding response OmpR family regulator
MKTILVVDDEESIRILYKKALETEGFNVILAENGEMALNKIDENNIDLMVLDIKMPGMNGMEVLKAMSSKEKHPAVLLNSAYSGYTEDYHSWIAEDYIIKTSDISVLINKVKEILNKK